MKVNDYVRFKTLSKEIKIGKVIEIIEPDKNSMKKYCVYDLDNNEATVDDYVIKSSPNIIDLIELGDYVNGYKITNVVNKEPCPSGKFVDIDCDKDSSDSYFFENDIKTIVTKEQFSQMEYRIGEWLYAIMGEEKTNRG